MRPPPIDASKDEPVVYTGQVQPDPQLYHGGIPPAVGVHRYQVLRATRSAPLPGDKVGWTYNHAPMLAYWRGRFYLEYVSNPVGEHVPPGRTLLVSSADGQAWSRPEVVFPVIELPAIEHPLGTVPAGTPAQMHQRSGFHISRDDRLLALGFYTWTADPHVFPNLGQGLGRVVREVYDDGTFGKIHVIRPNRSAGWDEHSLPFPMYAASDDAGFVNACKELLADRLATLAWWEEERSNDDGFYPFQPDIETKALSWYHRPDGVTVALWKHQYAALSPDDGATWTPVARTPTIQECGAKTWGQATADGRFALIYNHSATRRNRFPLVVLTGEDGHRFGDMLCLDGEVSPMRYRGQLKDRGPQYVRGIGEREGAAPDGDMWLTYSMNKEDLWVARVAVPVAGTVDADVVDDFNHVASVAELRKWNFHVPQWGSISLVEDPEGLPHRCLALRNEDPYEYVVAERVFPASERVRLGFVANARTPPGAPIECDIQDAHGNRPIVLRWSADRLAFDVGPVSVPAVRIADGQWHQVDLAINCATRTYDVSIDSATVHRGVAFATDVSHVNRIVFRTGAWRSDVRAMIAAGEPRWTGEYAADLPGAEQPCTPSVLLIRGIWTQRLH